MMVSEIAALIGIGAASFVLALSGALAPGPLLTITVAESARHGAWSGPKIILGHGILELALVALLLSGLAPHLEAEGTKLVISTAGGVILILMGGGLMKSARGASLELEPVARETDSRRNRLIGPVVSGVLGSVSNPYWSIWWATIGLGYLLSVLSHGAAGVMAFFLGHILADLLWYSLVSVAVARGGRAMGDRGYRFLLFFCGLFLLGFGAFFLSPWLTGSSLF